MPPRCPSKCVKNISGLHGQWKAAKDALEPLEMVANSMHTHWDPKADLKQQLKPESDEFNIGVNFDRTCVDWCYTNDVEDGEESEIEEKDWEDLNDDEFGWKLAEMAFKENSQDEDWICPRWRHKDKGKKGTKTHHNV